MRPDNQKEDDFMSKFTVYLVRHGLTTSNEKGLLRGSAGALVSEAGRSERKE